MSKSPGAPRKTAKLETSASIYFPFSKSLCKSMFTGWGVIRPSPSAKASAMQVLSAPGAAKDAARFPAIQVRIENGRT